MGESTKLGRTIERTESTEEEVEELYDRVEAIEQRDRVHTVILCLLLTDALGVPIDVTTVVSKFLSLI